MNNDFESSLKQFNEVFQDNDLVKQYYALKKQIDNDSQINQLIKELKFHQHKMCEYVNDDENYLLERQQYLEIEKKLKENPLFNNYLNVQEEMISLLNEIKDYLK